MIDTLRRNWVNILILLAIIAVVGQVGAMLRNDTPTERPAAYQCPPGQHMESVEYGAYDQGVKDVCIRND
jgi:hypothetical protein